MAAAEPASAAKPKSLPPDTGQAMYDAVGERKIELARMDPKKSGGYQTFSPAHHECPGGTPHVQGIACNSTNTQDLTTADCQLSDGSYADFWSFSGIAGQQVTITMTAAFDTYLFLLDPSAVVVASDDDGGGGTNSRIVFTLASSGNWFIVTNSFAANQFGAYTMTLSCSAAPGPTAGIPTLSLPALLLLMALLTATAFAFLRRG